MATIHAQTSVDSVSSMAQPPSLSEPSETALPSETTSVRLSGQSLIHAVMSACGALSTPVLKPCWKAEPKAAHAMAYDRRMFRP